MGIDTHSSSQEDLGVTSCFVLLFFLSKLHVRIWAISEISTSSPARCSKTPLFIERASFKLFTRFPRVDVNGFLLFHFPLLMFPFLYLRFPSFFPRITTFLFCPEMNITKNQIVKFKENEYPKRIVYLYLPTTDRLKWRWNYLFIFLKKIYEWFSLN